MTASGDPSDALIRLRLNPCTDFVRLMSISIHTACRAMQLDDTHPPTSVKGLVFDVQRFSLHDGPGIRTTVFFKGCPLRCRWCQNPESLRSRPEVAFYGENCQACFRCEAECPHGAIRRTPGRRVDFDGCDGCGRCVRVCPHEGLRQVGAWWSAEALVAEVLKDRDFFVDGGGVTLSGGEPFAQSPFLEKFLPSLKAAGLHVTVQTCGHFSWNHVAPLVPLIDLIYFDLKHMDPDAHACCTGAHNRRILENFTRLVATGARIEPRMPVIPGSNDDRANIRATARWLAQNDIETIRCLPYHNLGEAKGRRIGIKLEPLTVTDAVETAMARVQAAFAQEGIHAVIDD